MGEVLEPAVRPLTKEWNITCDWGGCSGDVVAERWSWDHGWLPVCEAHKQQDTARDSQTRRSEGV